MAELVPFTVTGPDGRPYTVRAEPGATDVQLIELAKAQVVDRAQATARDPLVKTPAEPADKSWTGVPGRALSSAPGSAVRFAEDIVQPIVHPVDTAKALYSLAAGLVQKLVPGEQANEAAANAVGKFLAERYGSVEAVKETLAEDPVGFLGDLSIVLSGGATAAARVPGVAAQAVTRGARAAARAVDPLALAGKGIGTAVDLAKPAAAAGLGLLTGTGSDAVRLAAESGRAGGEAERGFTRNLRGQESMTDVLDAAKAAVGKMRQQRGAEYRSGMVDVAADKTVLDFAPINKAMGDIAEVASYKGQSIRRSTLKTYNELEKLIDEWHLLDPKEFHTPEGLDALKKAVGDMRDSLEYGSPSRLMASEVYGAVRQQIVDQAPTYATVMRDYERASDLISEVERSLSLGQKATADSALRKLQSVLRNNANTNYGNRVDLVQELERVSGKPLQARLAGQALSSWLPRGLQGITGAATTVGGLTVNPALLAALPAMSPRLVGEAARGAGAATRQLDRLRAKLGVTPERTVTSARPVYQVGRIERVEEEAAPEEEAPPGRAEGGAVDDDLGPPLLLRELTGYAAGGRARKKPDWKKAARHAELKDEVARLKRRRRA